MTNSPTTDEARLAEPFEYTAHKAASVVSDLDAIESDLDRDTLPRETDADHLAAVAAMADIIDTLESAVEDAKALQRRLLAEWREHTSTRERVEAYWMRAADELERDARLIRDSREERRRVAEGRDDV